MKPLYGLILAIGLGIAAAIFNFAYLNLRSRDIDKVEFIGVKPGATISRGDRLSWKENLAPVGIPVGSVGNLDSFAIRWEDRQTVEGMNVWRTLSNSALLLRDDLRTPPQELKLGKSERALWIPVNNRRFVPSLIVPGDLVSFIVTKSSHRRPTPAAWQRPGTDADPAIEPEPETSPPPPAGPTEVIGPFKILSLGNRLGSAEVMQAAKIRQVQENVMTISAKVDAEGNLELKAQKLINLLEAMDFGGVGVLLHPRSPQ